jgi:YaiO family outer membrane protein
LLKKLVNIILLFSLVSSFAPAFAQNLMNLDSLFTVAKEKGAKKKYEKAEEICKQILSVKEDEDVRFYLGLLYSWDGKYDDARRELNNVQEKQPSNKEIIVARANVELWSKNPQTALQILNKALVDFPDDEEFLYMKALALVDLKKIDEAIAVLEHLLKLYPANEKAQKLLKSLKVSKKKNSISANYVNDFFDNGNIWTSGYIQYGRKIPLGELLARVNYAHRFGLYGLQYEADAYLRTSSSNYVYLNAGFSNASLFPRYRAGFEFFQALPYNFEASLGFRYFWFNSATSQVLVHTGSIGKYWKKYWLAFREYVTPLNGRVYYTELLEGRRFFLGDKENYVGFQYTHGSSPDENHTYLNNKTQLTYRSDLIKFTYSHRCKLYWIYKIRGGYEHGQYYSTSFLNKYTIDITLERIF